MPHHPTPPLPDKHASGYKQIEDEAICLLARMPGMAARLYLALLWHVKKKTLPDLSSRN